MKNLLSHIKKFQEAYSQMKITRTFFSKKKTRLSPIRISESMRHTRVVESVKSRIPMTEMTEEGRTNTEDFIRVRYTTALKGKAEEKNYSLLKKSVFSIESSLKRIRHCCQTMTGLLCVLYTFFFRIKEPRIGWYFERN